MQAHRLSSFLVMFTGIIPVPVINPQQCPGEGAHLPECDEDEAVDDADRGNPEAQQQEEHANARQGITRSSILRPRAFIAASTRFLLLFLGHELLEAGFLPCAPQPFARDRTTSSPS